MHQLLDHSRLGSMWKQVYYSDQTAWKMLVKKTIELISCFVNKIYLIIITIIF